MPLVTQSRMETLKWMQAVVVAAVVLPLTILAGGVYYLRTQVVANASALVERSARVAEEHALKVFETNGAILARISDMLGEASDERLHQREQELHTLFQRMSEGLPQMQGIFVMDSEGKMIATNRRFPAPRDLDFSDRPSFAHHRQGGPQPYISDLLISRITKEPFFDVSLRRSVAGGRFGGTLSTSLSPAYFADFYHQLTGNDPELKLALVRNDGAILARWPEPPVSREVAGAGASLLDVSAASAVQSGVVTSLPDGSHGLLACRTLGRFPVAVAVWIEDGALNAAWLRQSALLAALMAPIMTALVLTSAIARNKARRSLEAAEALRTEVQQREQIEEALRQAQKLEAMGRLTGGVAHDFNNLLMIVSNNLFIVSRQHPDLKDSRAITSMERAVASGAKLTRQLLSFSRRQPFRPQIVTLQEALPAIVDLVRPAVGSAISVNETVAADTLSIEVDTAELELAVLNLAINAKDAMPGGGKVRVEARNVQPNEVPPGFAAPMVTLTVSDNGQGIPVELQERVFEPFFTTKPLGHGTGLGLSQVYGFCQRAGGTARITSQPGVGTEVHLYLPSRREPSKRSAAAETQFQEQLGLRVLLAEDNLEVASATIAVLELLGCEVEHVPTGDEAKKLLDVRRGSFDLLLSDIVMPGTLNGVELARLVKDLHPHLPVLLMSGYSGHAAEAEALKLDVVPKPCTPEVLAEAIRRTGATSRD